MTEIATPTTTIEQTVRIAARPETVWSFWTEPERLREWWGEATALELQPGGDYRIVMDNGTVGRGRFVELDPPRRLVFTFGWEHNAPGEPLAPGSTRVEVTLRAEGDGTELVLRHTEVPSEQAPDHVKGWELFVGDRLVAAVTGEG
jgi:uncharacterized protein YndB with AHSA1/START domain